MVTADLENEASILYLFRSLVTTWDLRGWGKLGLRTGQIKMAASGHLALDDLRKLVIEKIEDVWSSLLHPSEILDVEDVLEKIDQIVEAVHCLDSSIRLPEDIYAPINAKVQHPPPGNPPGIWTFEDWLGQMPAPLG